MTTPHSNSSAGPILVKMALKLAYLSFPLSAQLKGIKYGQYD